MYSRLKPPASSRGPGNGLSVDVHCDLDLRDITLAQGHDTPLSHGQQQEQVCEILSRFNLAVMSYCSDKVVGYVCAVTLTLEGYDLGSRS